MFGIGTTDDRRIAAAAAVMVALLLPVGASAEQAGAGVVGAPAVGSGVSREEDNRTERTREILTAQGTWAGTVKQSIGEPSRGEQPALAKPAQTRTAAVAKPLKKRVRTHVRVQASTRPLNFYDIRRAMWFN